MRKKIFSLIIILTVMVFSLTGCDIVSTALINKQNDTGNSRTRSADYWSGISINPFTIAEGESTEVAFDVEMDKGSISFTIKNSKGEEVYKLLKKEAGIAADSVDLEKAGTYTLIEEASDFSGKILISWGDYEEEK